MTLYTTSSLLVAALSRVGWDKCGRSSVVDVRESARDEVRRVAVVLCWDLCRPCLSRRRWG